MQFIHQTCAETEWESVNRAERQAIVKWRRRCTDEERERKKKTNIKLRSHRIVARMSWTLSSRIERVLSLVVGIIGIGIGNIIKNRRNEMAERVRSDQRWKKNNTNRIT